MPVFKISFKSTSRLKKIWINGVRLKIEDGISEKALKLGNTYYLQWIVRGTPVDRYSIKISEPNGIAATLVDNKRLGHDQVGAGIYKFTL